MRSFATLILLLLLLLPVIAAAEIPKGMVTDFAPLNGYIIMPIGDEFLVDLDASASLQEGDILTLVMPGEKVIHPVTKEVLGSLDTPRGFLQVIRIKSGYSYAKLLYSDSPPEKGDQIKRFEQVPAFFSATPSNNKLFTDLKTGLPQLDWLDEANAAQALVSFNLNNNILTVKNSNGTILRSYQLSNDEWIATQPTLTRPTVFRVDEDPSKSRSPLNKTVNSLINSVGLGSSKAMVGGPGIVRNQQTAQNQGVWMSPNLQGSPVGISVADLDNDGQQETAIAMKNLVLINQISQGELNEEAIIELPVGTKLLSIDSFDLDGNGTPEIYLTATRDHKLTSMVIEYLDASYQISIKNVPWFLRVAELPGKGQRLIGQRTGDHDRPFYGSPFQVQKNGNTLQEGESISLPLHVTPFSFLPLPGDTGEQLIAYVTKGDYLKVVSSTGDEFWESGDYYGGSETSFYNTPPNDETDIISPIYIQKRIISGPSGEILVAQNDGLRSLERFRMFKDSRIIALTWNGFALQESWRTSGQNGYLADFSLADADNDGSDELVMAVKFKHKSLLQDPRSAIVIYELH